MSPRALRIGRSLITATSASLICFGVAWSQPGAVLSHQKISDTQGNFAAPLLNLDEFGGAVASLGDLDGPGPSVVALAVGASGDDDGGVNRGAVYILFLNSNGNVLSYQKISNTQGNFTALLDNADDFGGSVASLGDLDGPGPSAVALAVGATGDDDGGLSHGAVYILFLNGNGSVLSYQKISSTQGNFTAPLDAGDEFGGTVTSLGDLDGSGPSVAALAVGAIGDDDGGTDRGAVYTLFLDSTGNVLSYQKISDTQGNFTAPLKDLGEFGSAVASLGDLDGSGPSVATLAVGTTGDDDGGPSRGAVYVLFLDNTGNVLSYQKISNTQGNFTAPLDDLDEFGGALVGLGDLDGTGPSVAALAVGAVGDDDGGVDRGAVYVLFLDNTGNVLSHQKISDTQGNFTGMLADEDDFGGSVAALGDIDGKGPAAQGLVIGAAGDDDGGANRGAAFVLFVEGGPSTATWVALFEAEPLAGAVRLRWRFERPEELEEARVERAPSATGPWNSVGVEPVQEGGIMTIDDRTVVEGSSYSYRLVARTHAGETLFFGPLSVTAGNAIRDFELARVMPNPHQGAARIEYTVARGAWVRLAVLDIQGREVAVLAEGMHGPGRYLRIWDGTSLHGRAPSGTYFIRYQTPERTFMQRTVLVK